MRPESDDDDWLEAVAGRPRPDADPRTLLEATWLRAATRQWSKHELPDGALPADAVETLLARARAEGVLQRRGGCAGCADRWQRWRESWRAAGRVGPAFGGALGLAAAALGAAVVLGVWWPAHEAPEGEGVPVLRGAPADGVWLLRAAEPAALRDEIAAALTSAGVPVSRYERLGRFGLDADLGTAPGAEVLDTLRRRGLEPAADGSLRVEIESATP